MQQHDEYSWIIVCGNIPEEQLACCYTHMGAGHAPRHNPVIVLYSRGAVHRDKGLYR